MGFLKNRKTECGTGVFFVLLFFLTVAAGRMDASAATAAVSASSASAVTGDTVTVTVSVTSSDTIGGGDVYITYDASILEFVSGTDVTSEKSGSLYWLAFDMSSSVKELSVTLTFRALKAGTSSITIASSTEIYNEDAENISYTSSNGKVTVTTPSTDATLSSLKLTGTTDSGSVSTLSLSPSFSKNTTSYTATVESNITTVVTSATANDSRATVSVSSTTLTLKTGTNTVTVKVTAESGATKTYTVTITKKEAQTTTAEPTTTEETTTEETTEAETTEEETTEEETTEEETAADESLYVTVDGSRRILLREFEESMLPEGFEMTEITWAGETIRAGKGIYKDLTLVCLMDPDEESSALYILQEDGSFLLLRNYQTNAVLYTILPMPSEEAPEGFRETLLVMETDAAADDEVDAWQSMEFPDYYLIYAMNWAGETNYYLYDSVEGTFQRFDSDALSKAAAAASGEEETADAADATLTDATPADATPTDGNGADGSDLWKYIVMALEAAAIVILAAAAVRRGGRGNKTGGSPSGNEPDGGAGLDGENPEKAGFKEPFSEEIISEEALKDSRESEAGKGEESIFDGGAELPGGYFSEIDDILAELEKDETDIGKNDGAEQ